jgi:hypothetical protein
MAVPSVNFAGRKAHDYGITRLVLDGFPKPDSAGLILAEALRRWPVGKTSKFLILPGGFAETGWPRDWQGKTGWNTQPQDAQPLFQAAKQEIQRVITPELQKLAAGKVDFITIGIDVCSEQGTAGPHAELIAVYDVKAKQVMGVTGKSYPLAMQQRTLVQVTDLDSHFFKMGKDTVLVLGCNDLNMFSPRAIANFLPGSERWKRSKAMRELTEKRQPTVVLHHPHATDTPKTWHPAWGGIRKTFTRLRDWASGIGYYNYDQPDPRQPLDTVLRQTRPDNGRVLDIVVNTDRYPSQPGLYLKE